MTKYEENKALDLLKEIIEIPTINGVSNESALAKNLQDYFEKYGVESKIQVVDDLRSNIIAEIEGLDSKSMVIWNGHIDTVPYGDIAKWKTDPSKAVILEDKLFARGASDMKSGLAAMVYSICYMKKKGVIPPITIKFIGTCDEEKNGAGATKIMEANELGSPLAIIIGEPTDCNIGIAQKGCLWIKLDIQGKTSHAANPKEGINAIDYGFSIYRELKKYIEVFSHPLLGNSTVEMTKCSGGVANNMVPDKCEIIMDVRIAPDLSSVQVVNKLIEICNKKENDLDNNLRCSFEILNERIQISTRADNPWTLLVEKTIKEYEFNPKMIGINCFTDASIMVKDNKQIPVILFGPGTPSMAHKPNEYVLLTNYYKTIDILKKLYGESVYKK